MALDEKKINLLYSVSVKLRALFGHVHTRSKYVVRRKLKYLFLVAPQLLFMNCCCILRSPMELVKHLNKSIFCIIVSGYSNIIITGVDLHVNASLPFLICIMCNFSPLLTV